MKRRQVLTGMLAFTAAGIIPRSRHFDGSANTAALNELAGQQSTGVINRGQVDIDPPALDPLSDSENRPRQSALHSAKGSAKQLAKAKQEQANTKTLTTPSESSSPEIAEVKKAKPVVKVNKNIDFERNYDDDLYVAQADQHLLHSVSLRLKNVQKTIGYGRFNIVSFDDAINIARRYNTVGQFTPAELDFIEKIFFANAEDYGFYGEKVVTDLSLAINKKEAKKIPNSGHYVFRDQSLAFYDKLHKNVGDSIILTSGIRSNVKQLHLFLAKVIRVKGNLSRASRSLAPPGYSYHGIGDFDVGRIGWGMRNFTEAFADTDEFKRMQDLGYVAIRYDQGNEFGVRFEPWHIKVV